MRDKQVTNYFNKWGGFRTGFISSNKLNEQKNLSEVLLSSASERFFLSPKACAGILRRAEKRGKKLPPQLYKALHTVALEMKE